MGARKLARTTDIAAVAVAAVVLVFVVDAGPGWAAQSTHSVLAVHLEHSAAAPLYDALAAAATLLPVGEPGFRIAVLGALLGALALAGIVAAARALVPREPTAGYAAALLLLLAPPFRDALVTPQILAACGTIWAFALAARFARSKAPHDAACALAACAVVVGTAPWLGAGIAIVIGAWLAREHAAPQLLALAGVATGLVVVALWWNALGSVPGLRVHLADAIAASGRGAGAIVVGAGLLGLAFGVITALPRARWLVAMTAVVAAHELLVGGSAAVLLGALATGTVIVVAAIARIVAATDGAKRDALVFACGLPFMIAALAIGVSGDAPGATPTRLAGDLVSDLPPGPGVFIATRAPSWFALHYERTVAGKRADLVLVPPLPGQRADVIAANGLRDGKIVGADAAAFGRLDVQLAVPRGRGFQLVGAVPANASPVEPPADYATAIGAEQAIFLALERARIEAASGRLDGAARAAGLVEGAAGGASALGIAPRFRAADLAVLGATVPTHDRPALFGFLPLSSAAPGPWLVEVFGDDLAWVAGLAIAPLSADAPMPRRLHAVWRTILAGKGTPADATPLGPTAVDATTTMLHELRP